MFAVEFPSGVNSFFYKYKNFPTLFNLFIYLIYATSYLEFKSIVVGILIEKQNSNNVSVPSDLVCFVNCWNDNANTGLNQGGNSIWFES